jgi:hypothetical protein
MPLKGMTSKGEQQMNDKLRITALAVLASATLGLAACATSEENADAPSAEPAPTSEPAPMDSAVPSAPTADPNAPAADTTTPPETPPTGTP